MLSHFCRNPASDDPIALEAAVLLGRLCVDDDNARAELKRSLESTTSDTHKKAKVNIRLDNHSLSFIQSYVKKILINHQIHRFYTNPAVLHVKYIEIPKTMKILLFCF